MTANRKEGFFIAVKRKQYAYSKGTDTKLGTDFAEAKRCGKGKPGKLAAFRKSGLWWCRLPVSEIQQIFRRIEPAYGKLRCGRRSYMIECLVLLTLMQLHPNLQYGKV